MIQQGLPFFNSRDRGRLNAIRNLLASISDELRKQAEAVQGIVDFSTQELPSLLREFSPFQLESSDHQARAPLSTQPFKIEDFSLASNRPAVFSSTTELLQSVDVQKLSAALKDVELIGIDESKVDTPLPYSAMAFLRSIAFRMYRTDEAVGPLLSEMRLQWRDSEGFELENQLLGYLRNNYVAYLSALTAIAEGRKPFVVLHGPLVRAIGAFSQLSFDYKTVESLLNVVLDNAGDFGLPINADKDALIGDVQTTNNLPLAPAKAVNGTENVRKFNEFCIFTCGRKCARDKDGGSFPVKAVPPAVDTITQTMMEGRRYPGFCLYFWLMRSLFDLQRLGKFNLISAVEDISASTEFTRLVLPSLFAIQQVRQRVNKSSLKVALKAVGIRYPDQPHRRADLYEEVKNTIERFSFTDSNILSFTLSEGQYTAPIEIYRYRSKRVVTEALGYEFGINNEFEPMLKVIFPFAIQPNHPGYRVVMSYIRTTPLREPVRFEYFDLPHITSPADILGPAYLLSLPYQEYGIPVILYYADKLAHTPMQLVRTIIEREYLDLVLENKFTDPVSIMQILGKLSRGYLQREGLK